MNLMECKARILAGQHLTRPAQPQSVCRDLNGIQAQFAAAALHSLHVRTLGEPDIGGLVKSWTLRGTLHLFAQSDLPLYLHEGRTPFLRPADTLDADEALSADRKQLFANIILRTVAQGVDQRECLREICRAHGMTEAEEQSAFNSWGGLIRALAETGKLCYQGGTEKRFVCCAPFEPMPKDKAHLEMARRYFTHCGPATVKDAAYFFGIPQKTVKAWLAALPVSAVAVEGQTRYFIAEKDAFVPDIPRCMLLAHFDPLLLSYEKKESLFLPAEAMRAIFTLAGIVMPTVLLDGTVVARWKLNGRKLEVLPLRALQPSEKKVILQTAETVLQPFQSVVWEA